MIAGPSPYEAALGPEQFAQLPRALRELHGSKGPTRWRGRARVTCGPGIAAAIARQIAGLPHRSGEMPITFEIKRGISPDGSPAERWTRRFGSREFTSVIGCANGRLYDQFGPGRFYMDTLPDRGILSLPVNGASLFGLRLPRAAWPEPHAYEREDAHGRFRFDVRIAFRHIGLIVAYEGWLEPAADATRSRDG